MTATKDSGTSDRGQLASSGATRTALENAMSALFKEYYGRGPTAAKGWLLDEYVFVVLEGGLTRNEQTLLDAGREEDVRRFRLAFQQAVRQRAIDAVASVTGCSVVAYHSQVVFDPPRSFEIFVLDRSEAPELRHADERRADAIPARVHADP